MPNLPTPCTPCIPPMQPKTEVEQLMKNGAHMREGKKKIDGNCSHFKPLMNHITPV